MGEKSTTEHTQIKDKCEVPGYLQEFTEITDLEKIDFIQVDEPTDEGLNSAIRHYLNDGALNIDAAASIKIDMERTYTNFYKQYYNPLSEEELKKSAEKGLEEYQKDENEKADRERRFPINYKGDPKFKDQFIKNHISHQKQQVSDAAARLAKKEAFASLTQIQSTQADVGIKQEQKNAAVENAAKEAIEYMNKIGFEYLTRGAILVCTGGGIWRHLNLPADHGVFYGKKELPVINKKDCEVGDTFNICTFGTCSGSNPPSVPAQLDDMVSYDEQGRAVEMQKEDSLDRGYKCIPEIAKPGWINTYHQTGMGQDDAVSTKSFLVCIHGGIIYPVNSGQLPEPQLLLDDGDVKDEYDQLCMVYATLKQRESQLKKELADSNTYPHEGSIAAIGGTRRAPESIEGDLEENAKKQDIYRHEIKICMDKVRADSYKWAYDDIPDDRKKTLAYMINGYGSLTGWESPSVKSDYYRYRRRYGYNTQSVYADDNPRLIPGSDAYTDWRAARTQQKNFQDNKKEYEAWAQDVASRGYDSLSEFEREEFDRAKKRLSGNGLPLNLGGN